MRLTSRRDGFAILAAGLVAVALVLTAQFGGVAGGLENDSVSARFKLRGSVPARDVAVVAIDDVTFSDLQVSWPFKRSLHARAIDRLREAGAKRIVYDVQFTEPTTEREDSALYDALERTPGVILATTETDGSGNVNILGGDENLEAVGAIPAAANLVTDRGSVVHRFPYSSGGLATVGVQTARTLGVRPSASSAFGKKGAWIDYAGPPGSVPTVSFSDLVEGRADPRKLRGKIVVVGAAAATLQDVHATPTSSDRLMYGPEIQANAISTVLRGFPLRSAPGWLSSLFVLLLGLAPALAQLRVRGLRGAALSPLAALVFLTGAYVMFEGDVVIEVTYPLMSLALGTAMTMSTAYLSERRERDRVVDYNEILEQRVRERTEELRVTQLEIIRRLGQAAESRDEATGEHIERLSRLSRRLALEVGLSPDEAEVLGHASAMHDIGKIGIPDRVLLKPGRLDPAEWEVMHTHTTIGANILAGSSSPLLQLAESIARTHHERWDGSGYPAGLKGEEIPLAARICTICDVFDALVSTRHYKPRWALEDALHEIAVQRGRHFDPDLVDAFLKMVPELGESLLGRTSAPPVGVATLAPERLEAQTAPTGATERRSETSGPLSLR